LVVLEVINGTRGYGERMEEEGDRGKVARGGSEIPLAWWVIGFFTVR